MYKLTATFENRLPTSVKADLEGLNYPLLGSNCAVSRGQKIEVFRQPAWLKRTRNTAEGRPLKPEPASTDCSQVKRALVARQALRRGLLRLYLGPRKSRTARSEPVRR